MKIAFSFKTDIAIVRIFGEGILAELREELPQAIQNAGHLYCLTKIFSKIFLEKEEEEASFVRGCVATHPTVRISDKIYLQHVLASIGVGDE
jgi:hypothetical protein